MLLRIREPYDFALSTARYRVFGPDLANLWVDGGLHRAIGGREVRIECADGGIRVEPFDTPIGKSVAKLLGFEFDLLAFYDFVEQDPVLAKLVPRLVGLRPPLAPDPFESLITSITAQQVTMKAAFAIRNRLIVRYGRRVGQVYSFPAAERLAAALPEDLAALGLSRRKAEYIVGLAAAALDYDRLSLLPDEQVKAHLTAVRGLGEWTADWFLARHLARPQAWPAGDLGLRKAVSAFYGDGGMLTTLEVRAMGSRFAPFQNLTAHYLLAGWLTAT